MSENPAVIDRTAARVFLFDAAGRVLLLHGFDPARPDETIWTTVGGGLDPGETEAEAAARELREEVGVVASPVELGSPVHAETFEHSFDRQAVRQSQVFFVLRADSPRISFDGQEPAERASMLGYAWWSVAELETTTEQIFPRDMAALLRRLGIAGFWDDRAAVFDDEPDHGLRDPRVRAAWAERLHTWLPSEPADVLDLGCGTGSLLLLLAEQGHLPVGVDLSGRMVEQARAKLATGGFEIPVHVGDASAPPVPAGSYDVVLARHLLWTLPDPHQTLAGWLELLRPGGRLVLVEGHWNAGEESYVAGIGRLPWDGGVDAATLTDALRPLVPGLEVVRLDDPLLWGRVTDDERYAVLAYT